MKCSRYRRERRWTKCSAKCTNCAAACARWSGRARHRLSNATATPKPAGKTGAAESHGLRMLPMNSRIQFDPCRSRKQFAEFSQRLQQGSELLRSVKDRDVQIATTPKTEVFRQDKTTLYHYEPMAKRTFAAPVLVVYGLVGRYTMADLQEDRSLIRNLLAQGVDLYAVDWGNPNARRSVADDRRLCRRLPQRVRRIHLPQARLDSINVLGICEGGVFTLCYAALYPDRVKNLIVTITPVDFHADQAEGRTDHGFINLWTRSLTPEDVDRLIEANGNLPGELMSFVFSTMTPLSQPDQIQPRAARCRRRREEAPQLPAHGEVAGRPSAPPRRGRQAVAQGPVSAKQAGQGRVRARWTQGRAAKITMPVLNVYAKEDHIIPPKMLAGLARRASAPRTTARSDWRAVTSVCS